MLEWFPKTLTFGKSNVLCDPETYTLPRKFQEGILTNLFLVQRNFTKGPFPASYITFIYNQNPARLHIRSLPHLFSRFIIQVTTKELTPTLSWPPSFIFTCDMKELTLAPSNSSSSSSSFTCNSSSTDKYTYDIFLSFRGQDTRNGFTGHLYKALCGAGFHTFIDNRLEKGKEITPALLEAIKKSRIAIVILSENYASSTFCLKELVKIFECIKQESILPIFYKVDPSNVRHLRGSYEKALVTHEERFKNNEEEVQNWKSALHKVANLSGWPFDEERYEYEYMFVEEIVKEVSKRINQTPLFVAKYPIALKCRVEKVISHLELRSTKKVVMVGIHGFGGIGKTTIACAVYNAIIDQFEDACFLSDVRERSNKHGLEELQEKLLAKLTGEQEIKVDYVRNGIQIIRRKLCQKRVLLILDDVNSQEQLRALAGGVDWFGNGSRIIMTTRDKHLLDVHGVSRNFEVKELCFDEAIELFSWNAFKKNEVDSRYTSIINHVTNYCNGLPLALEIIGSNLFGKTQEEWKSALDIYEKIPNKNVQDTLKVSYTSLEENEQKIFLDIACFFNGYRLSTVKRILLNVHGYDPTYVIGALEKKSLIRTEISHLKIHDLMIQMAREIVRSQSPSNPGYWNRLWSYEDILSILEDDKGSEKIEFLMLNMPPSKEVLWNGKAFKKMKNLKILIIENARFSCGPKYLPNSLRVLDWKNYPSSALPSDFHPRNLGILNLRGSSLKFVKPLKNFESLTELVLKDCRFLKHVPDISEALSLKILNVRNCRNLVEVHDSVGFLNKLVLLDVYGCSNLRVLPISIKSASFRTLDLSGCYRLQSVPEVFGVVENNFATISFDRCSFSCGCLFLFKERHYVQLNCGVWMLPKLENWMDEFQHFNKCSGDDQKKVSPALPVSLSIYGLAEFACEIFPSPTFDLDWNNLTDKCFSTWRPFYYSLTELCLWFCNLTEEFLHQRLPWFPNLIELKLEFNKFTTLPECMNECHHLKTLTLDGCRGLQEVKGIPPNIKFLSLAHCISLTSQSLRKLLSQSFHEDGGREVTVPGYRIPKWLDHRCAESSISFWFLHEFPRLSLWLVGILFKVKIRMFINGIEVLGFTPPLRRYFFVELNAPCIQAYDVHEWGKKSKIALREDEWNHVLILDDRQRTHGMGVHVYKKEKGADNVRFINPNPLNRTFTINHKSDLITSFSLSKKFCPLLGMQVFDTTTNSREREAFDLFMGEGAYLVQDEMGEGIYSVKCETIWKAISVMEAPTKVKWITAKISHEKLESFNFPTCCDLFRRKLVKSPMCRICERAIETTEHVFFECPWTQPLWFAIDLAWIMNDKWPLAYGILYWLRQKLDHIMKLHPNAESVIGLMGNIFWVIWKARNEFILKGKPVNPLEALMTANAMHMQYSSEASTSTIHSENVKGAEAKNKVRQKRKNVSKNNTEMEPTCDKGAEVENKANQRRKRASNKIENKVNRRIKGVSNNNAKREANSDKGTQVENKTKRKRKGVSNDPEIEPDDCEKGTQVESKAKRKKGEESNNNTKREPNCDKAEGLVVLVPLDYISITNPKIQEISCNISRQDDDFGKNEEPNNEQLDSTSNQENPDLANVNIQLEVPICDIQPQGTTLDPKQPIPTETLPEECSTSLNDDEEEDPFAVLHSLVSADESISTSMSHIFEQESQPNSERASQIKQAVIILNNVLEQDLDLLLSNQEDREKLESSLKILQSTTGEDALVTFDFKAFILQLSNQLPSMLENMSKSSDTEKAYQSLIRHKRSLVEFKEFGDQQKQQLADKRRACIEKVKANSNQILALRARISELQKELEQLEKTQPELEAAVKAVDIEEQNLIQRAKDVVKDFKSTTSMLSGMEAERKAMIEVKNKTLIQWQNFRSIFDSSFKKLIED